MTDEIEFQEAAEAPKEELDTSAETEALNDACKVEKLYPY